MTGLSKGVTGPAGPLCFLFTRQQQGNAKKHGRAQGKGDDRRTVSGGRQVGLEGTTELMLYLPGTPLAELPEGFVLWARLQGLPEETETLPCFGLYNAAQDAGFIGYYLDR